MEYNIVRQKNRKRVQLSVDNNMQVTVKVPMNLPRKYIDKIIADNETWLKAKIKQKDELTSVYDWYRSGKIEYHGQATDIVYTLNDDVVYDKNTFYIGIKDIIHRLESNLKDADKKLIYDNNSGRVYTKINLYTDDASRSTNHIEGIYDDFEINNIELYKHRYGMQLEQAIREKMYSKLKGMAYDEFVPIIKQYADDVGVMVGKITIRNQSTRWGSCSYEGNISLNVKLVMMDLLLSQYVILHEVMHRVHFDHSKEFWNDIGKLMPDYKARKQKLNLLGNRYIL